LQSSLGEPAIFGGIADFADRRRRAVAHFLEPERRERTIELALEQEDLLVERPRAEQDVS
jgi:hypothetical protein